MQPVKRIVVTLIWASILATPTSHAAGGGAVGRAFLQVWKHSTVTTVKNTPGTRLNAGIAINGFERQFVKSYGNLSDEEFISRIRSLEGMSKEHIEALERTRRADFNAYNLNHLRLLNEVAVAIDNNQKRRLIPKLEVGENLRFRSRDDWSIEPREDTERAWRVDFKYQKNAVMKRIQGCQIRNLCLSAGSLVGTTIEFQCGLTSVTVSPREMPSFSTTFGGVTFGTQLPGT